MNTENHKLKDKVDLYKQVLENTVVYRKAWQDSVKQELITTLQQFLQDTGLKGKIIDNNEIENLGSIHLDLGRSSSGIAQGGEADEVRNFMIKNNGALLYQQLFNGKLMVMVQHPHIEGYGEPKEPQFLEIVTPRELSVSLVGQHLESLLNILTEWEDFDDEGPQKKTVFQPIGFQHTPNLDKTN
jgi:hypothetical protein